MQRLHRLAQSPAGVKESSWLMMKENLEWGAGGEGKKIGKAIDRFQGGCLRRYDMTGSGNITIRNNAEGLTRTRNPQFKL